MINRHLRKAVVVTAAITAGLLMTACQNGADGSASGKSGTDAAAVAEKASNSKNSKGVSGSFKNGKVTYLAPGKYIVSVPGKNDQQFWVADDTEVYGVGTICGEAGSKVDAPCTLDQLESAVKKAAVSADVELKNGVATLVTERRAAQQDSGSGSGSGSDSDSGSGSGSGSGTGSGSDSDSRETVIEGVDKGKGVNGTWFGNVSYLAPGKYTVSDMKGVEQQFLVAEDTEIWGYGDICGDTNTDEGGQGGTECTEAELEAAARKGFSAEVVISNGIATTIRDDH
ncbi:hypothetical protein [Streptomyces europaeiscabiei]|uniref:hypothetical protein n=1 Tax=Streptomyces europaeiscabiei TaxID=146819 RepID=UPI001F09B14C|nr:hypothetical protein [Streptomyces europaeiscabiei]MDX3668066.1 hypothetical protein [Streptomyces europaeiscabiei]MDX3831076.1 hypothetical protein [Streptomyces europaeiscabiei]MDX3841328.1 hypothetical protein [Streptomyces europaeiscabiei]MDX3862748.1 hypothetical protein [Streptomyces europaeiscabiei]MDX3870899.1 hypothetical protein [Streptomyces europaeiscabiei]